MGDKPGRKPKSSVLSQSAWHSIELFLLLILVSKVGAVIHQVSS